MCSASGGSGEEPLIAKVNRRRGSMCPKCISTSVAGTLPLWISVRDGQVPYVCSSIPSNYLAPHRQLIPTIADGDQEFPLGVWGTVSGYLENLTYINEHNNLRCRKKWLVNCYPICSYTRVASWAVEEQCPLITSPWNVFAVYYSVKQF
jgi:hypothetical protein